MKRKNKFQLDKGAMLYQYDDRPSWYLDLCIGDAPRRRVSLGTVSRSKAFKKAKEEYKLKDRQERAVPINQALRSILEEQIASNNGSEWVFCTMNGKPYSKSTITHRLYDTAVRAGIQRVSFKMFRNTFATLNAQTMPPFVVKELLGHSSIATTEKHYVGKLNSFCPVPVVFNK